MKNKTLIITEANETVATGHLFESAELAKRIIEDGQSAVVLVNDDAKYELKAILPVYREYHSNIEAGYTTISQIIRKEKYSVIVTNLREISNDWVLRFKSDNDVPLVCIDEWGHRQLDCDIIINPMIDPYYWDYEGSKAKLYCGHEYLVLPSALQEYHGKVKNIRRRIERICVSMGGVDKEGTTLKILGCIKDRFRKYDDFKWDIIIGAGFKFQNEFNMMLNDIGIKERIDEGSIAVHRNPHNIYELFYQADIAMCAGGNTLHELACIGTPALIIPTVPHEKRNGEEYERRGYGKCLDISERVSGNLIYNAFEEMQDVEWRKRTSFAGKNITDGSGAEKMLRVIKCIFSDN